GVYDDALVVKFRRDGRLDPAFGTAGIRRLSAGVESSGVALAVQADGKILVLRLVLAAAQHYLLTRLNADGSVDETYAAAGPTPGTALIDEGQASHALFAVAAAPDGRAVVAGWADFMPAVGLLRAVNADGTLSGSATAALGSGGTFTAVAYDAAHDDFVAAGPLVASPTVHEFAFARAKLTPGGAAVDPGPWTGALAFLSPGVDTGTPFALTLDDRGRAVAAGDAGGTRRFAIARLLPGGGPDPNFGPSGTGIVQVGLDGPGARGVIAAGGKIVAAGADRAAAGQDLDFTLARLNDDGTPDAAFGANGLVHTDPGGNHGDDEVMALAALPDGRLVVLGAPASGGLRAYLARYWN
ncbi:MAG TPA: hypothetical protein VHN99_01015, partial [Deinococcales bacterium]|nr:hypothetical protein [Deinococcales bacterium]